MQHVDMITYRQFDDHTELLLNGVVVQNVTDFPYVKEESVVCLEEGDVALVLHKPIIQYRRIINEEPS